MPKQSAYLAVLVLLASAAIAVADPLEDIRHCGGIDDSVKRLACFDTVANTLQASANKKAKAAIAKKLSPTAMDTGAWRISTEKSKIDDSTTIYAYVRAEAPVQIRYGQHVPTLWIRCRENTTALIIDFDGAFVADSGGYGYVTFRVDKKKAVKRSLRESTNNQSLGLWNGAVAIPFIRSLLGGKTLIVRATPFNESAVTFEFDIAGIEGAAARVAAACGWTVRPKKHGSVPATSGPLPLIH